MQECNSSVDDDYTSEQQGSEHLDSTFGDTLSGSLEVIPDAVVQPQTLQQEFALINVNIPNVTVEQVRWFYTDTKRRRMHARTHAQLTLC